MDQTPHPVAARRVRSPSSPPTSGTSVLPLPSAIARLYHRQTSLDPSWERQQIEEDTRRVLQVTHALSLGAAPALHLAWNANANWFKRGFRVEVFISDTGFASMSTMTPVEQLDHGRCIHESHRSDEAVVPIGEGQSFVTVLLIGKKPVSIFDRYVAKKRQQWTGSPVQVAAVVRFSAVVPSLRLANDRIGQQTKYNKSVVENIAARVEVASASGELDTNWYAARHEADVRRQTEELLATWRGIEAAFATERERIESNHELSPSRRQELLAVLNSLRLSRLRMHQLPVTPTESSRPARDTVA